MIFPEVAVATKLFFNAYAVNLFAKFCTSVESLIPISKTAVANSSSLDPAVTVFPASVNTDTSASLYPVSVFTVYA